MLLLLILVLLPAYAFILGLRVVAEGVETKEMFDAVAALGCDEAQGYFISRPQECELLRGWFPTSAWKIRSDA